MSNKNKSFYSTKLHITKNIYQICEYNELNFLIKIAEYNSRHKLRNTFTYTYDNDNKVMGICITDSKKTKVLTVTKDQREKNENTELFQQFNPYPIK